VRKLSNLKIHKKEWWLIVINYNFESLSSYDFELLTRDLLQRHLIMYLDNFKSGRDGGIDLRGSRSKDKTLIVQCKHYVKSSYSSLITELKKESIKVATLNPSRYILVTSQGLTQNNKEEIKKIFEPYIKNTEDIFSRDNLNNLLGQYPEIERQHFKLWLSSQNVLDRIIHNEVFNKSEIAIETIKERISLYVQNESYFTAKKILSEINYCIIAGVPGIGKTTLAEILILDYLANDYEVYKVSSISEAFKVYHKQKKQVFYYDDFLGQTSLEMKLNKQEDVDILQFISMTKKSSNTKFILTTREYILNQAKSTYERLSTSDFDIQKCVIDLVNYTKMDKAQILFNHFYFSEMPREVIDQLLENKNYRKIINHPNYSPRIIERMTIYYDGQQENYVNNLISNLDNPLRVWEHPFNFQISNCARNLLLVMASMSAETLMSDLKIALKSFEQIREESSTNKDFNMALKELEGNFIDIILLDSEYDYAIRYNNPSIKDFIEHYMAANFMEFSNLCKSAVFFDQLVTLRSFVSKKDKHNHLILKCIPDYLVSLKKSFTSATLKYEKTSPWDNNKKIDKVPISLIDRFVYVLDLSSILPMQELTQTLNQLEEILFGLIDVNEHNREKFLILLAQIKKYNFQSYKSESAWVKLFKEILLKNLKDIYTFNLLTDLLNEYPSEFADCEVDEIKSLFIDFHKNEVLDYLDDALDYSELEEYLEILENVSNYLEVEMEDDVLFEIDSKRHELSVLLHEPDFDDYREEWNYDSDRDCDNDQIDSLFDGLKG
jgi:hypothetical protein